MVEDLGNVLDILRSDNFQLNKIEHDLNVKTVEILDDKLKVQSKTDGGEIVKINNYLDY